MNPKAISECMRLSFADWPFPAVAAKLAAAGVTAYTADLIALRNTYYDAGNGCVEEPMPLAGAPPIPAAFDAAAVAAAVRAIQQQKTGYAAFLRQIMRAGCARYSVFVAGRKALYFGRDGEFHTELFPARAPAVTPEGR